MDLKCCEWVADLRSYLALSFEDVGNHDVKKTVALLKDAASSFLYNYNILEEVENFVTLGKHASPTDIYKRISLTCLAFRCCLIEEHDCLFLTDYEMSPSLPPIVAALTLAEKLKVFFPDTDDIDSIMQLMLLYLVSNKSEYESIKFEETFEKFQSRAEKLANDHISEKLGFKDYVYSILCNFSALNKSLDKPLLVCIEERLQGEEVFADSLLFSFEDKKAIEQCISNAVKTLSKNSNHSFLSDAGCDQSFPNNSAIGSACDQTSFASSDKTTSSNSSAVNSGDSGKSTLASNLSNVKKTRKHFRKEKKPDSFIVSVKKPIRRKWTEEEDAFIIKQVKLRGHDWKSVSSSYPFEHKKTGMQIKDRWRMLIKHRLVKVDKRGKVIFIDDCYKTHLAKQD